MAEIPRTADALVIGGGIIGASIACALAERGAATVLCEAGPYIGVGSTGASVGGIRQQFAEPHNVRLSQQSVAEFTAFEERYGRPIDFVRNGYLLLATREETWRRLQRDVAVQRDCGVTTEVVQPEDVERFVPGLRCDDVLGAAFGPEDGFADPSAIAHGFAAGARRAGARLLLDTPVTGLVRDGARVTGVETPSGAIGAPAVINAAGARLADIARWAGVHLAARPTRRHVFVTAPTDLLARTAPLTIDLDGPCYFRPESGGVLFSGAEEEPCGPDEEPPTDWSRLEAVVERVTHRLPRLAAARVLRGWAGVRTLTPDRTALIGPVASVPGFYVAGGFSGHGVMHSPAVGRIMADVVCDGQTDRCDLAPFAPERFDASPVDGSPRAI